MKIITLFLLVCSLTTFAQSDNNSNQKFENALTQQIYQEENDVNTVELLLEQIKEYELNNNKIVLSDIDYNKEQVTIQKLESRLETLTDENEIASCSEKITYIKTKIVSYSSIKTELK
jgi:hypothetical protein